MHLKIYNYILLISEKYFKLAFVAALRCAQPAPR